MNKLLEYIMNDYPDFVVGFYCSILLFLIIGTTIVYLSSWSARKKFFILSSIALSGSLLLCSSLVFSAFYPSYYMNNYPEAIEQYNAYKAERNPIKKQISELEKESDRIDKILQNKIRLNDKQLLEMSLSKDEETQLRETLKQTTYKIDDLNEKLTHLAYENFFNVVVITMYLHQKQIKQ